MRPTVIRLIVGGALGIAFSVSLTLPGAVVFPEEPPIRHLAVPQASSTLAVQAAPVAARKKTPAPRQVVVRPVYAPRAGAAPAASVVRHAPRRTRPSTKLVARKSPPTPSRQRLTPLSVRRTWERDERPDEARKRAQDDDHEGGGDRAGG